MAHNLTDNKSKLTDQMAQWYQATSLASAKPLSEPMLEYC